MPCKALKKAYATYTNYLGAEPASTAPLLSKNMECVCPCALHAILVRYHNLWKSLVLAVRMQEINSMASVSVKPVTLQILVLNSLGWFLANMFFLI